MTGKVQLYNIITLLCGTIVCAASPQQLKVNRRAFWGSDAQHNLDSDFLRLDSLDLNTSTRAAMGDFTEATHGDIIPAVTAKVEPLFFQRASNVMVQLVRDHLSKTFLGSLETYADGELDGAFS